MSQKAKEEVFKLYKTNENGLNQKEINDRLQKNGKNIASENKKRGWLYFFIQSFKDKFIMILLVLAVIDYISGDSMGAWIIVGISFASAMLRFAQDYSTYRFNEKLKAKIKPKANVIRNGKQIEILAENIAIGDIVTLSAGSVVPADLMLIDSKDLFVNQSVFTGESVSVEKEFNKPGKMNDEIFDLPNICFMGSSVISGNGIGVVITTGLNTYMGNMNKDIDTKRAPTNFENGMEKITKMLIKYMLIISVAVFVIYGFIRKDLT